jgi:hypothetical protein
MLIRFKGEKHGLAAMGTSFAASPLRSSNKVTEKTGTQVYLSTVADSKVSFPAGLDLSRLGAEVFDFYRLEGIIPRVRLGLQFACCLRARVYIS